jgi:DNA-binding MarR family transcriptional regulator
MNKPTQTHHSPSVLRVLDALSKGPSLTQRDVARATGLSLGMVNAILRRLSTTGYIKIKGLTGRKLSYMLTPHGLTEKARRSTEYLKHTIETYEKLRLRLAMMLRELESKGQKRLLIVGDGEVAKFTEMSLKELGNGFTYSRVNKLSRQVEDDTLVLDCTSGGGEPAGISVLSRLIGLTEEDANGHRASTEDHDAKREFAL